MTKAKPGRKRKKEMGRPVQNKNKLPPRIDATPEEIVQAFFKVDVDVVVTKGLDYRCRTCDEEVRYPEVLHRDGQCSKCMLAVG